MKAYVRKKLGTAVLIVTVAFGGLAPFGVRAQSSADLTAQVNSLLATIASLQAQLNLLQGGSAPAGTQALQITRDLTIGSTGADVTALQNWLIARGFSIPAGATGYFGAQTQAAVAAYQRANGIVPSAGYVGAITRAKIASVTAPTPIPTPSQGDDEGELRNFDTIGDTESVVRESESDIQILGIEFEAEDSDMRLERVDVEFRKSNGSGSNRLERYADSVTLWLDGKRIGSANISRSDRNGSVYEYRFTNLNATIDEGDTAELYIAVDASSNIDSDDMGTSWTVTIPEDGIRARDEVGISDTYPNTSFDETFEFSDAESGNLEISEGDDNPEDGVVIVSDSKDTDGVIVLEFEIEADGQDVEIEDIPVSLAVTGNANDVGDIVKTVKLMQGSKTLKSRPLPANAGTYEEIVFADLRIEIEDGDAETFRIVVDIRKLNGDFAEGDSLIASTTDGLAGWDAEDARGDDASISGSAEGGAQTFFTTGIDVDLVSVTESKIFTADDAGESDVGEFRIVVDITALEDDVYIDRSATRATSGTAGDGFLWATTTGTTAEISGSTAAVSSARTVSGDTSDLFVIREGDTRRFTLIVNTTAGSSGFAGIRLAGINWTTDGSDASPDNFYTVNLNRFVSDLIFLNDL